MALVPLPPLLHHALKVGALSYEGIDNWVTTGGGGGRANEGGTGGNSDVFDWVEGGGGRQGGVTSPRGGEKSIPIVFRGTRCAFVMLSTL